MVKFYTCPQGQAAVTADSLRDEYGLFPGVRVAGDERTSQVIVQAPPEIQVRISQKLAAAFPNQQPASQKAAAGAVQVRQIPLKQIQADRLEATLWNTLGNRLTVLPNQQVASRGYRLALSNGGAVEIWIDFANKQVKLEGSSRGRRCRQPHDPASGFAAERGGKECPSDALATGRVGQRPPCRFDDPCCQRGLTGIDAAWRPCSCNRGPMPRQRRGPRPPIPQPAPAPGSGERPSDIGGLSRIVNPVQMDVIEGLDVLVLRGGAQDVQQMMQVVQVIEELTWSYRTGDRHHAHEARRERYDAIFDHDALE